MKEAIRLLIVAVMMLTVSLNVNAQFKKKENNRVPDRFHMGIRGGYSQSTGDVSSIGFPHGGIGVDFQVAPIPLFLETGLYYMNKGQIDWDGEDEDHLGYVPLLISYHINLAPNLFLQPFAGGIAGYLGTTEDFEAAVRIGLGFNFGRLYANTGFDLGLIEHEKNINSFYGRTNKWTNYTAFVTIGFNWAGSR